MEVIYSINGKYFKAFGVYISESKGLLDKLKPKPRKAYDWAEYHGKVVDLSAPKYEEREITLTGWIEGKNWHEMKQNFDALLSEFDKGGLVRLLVEFGKELVYDVYLDGAVELEKSFKEGEIIGKFSLKLKEPNPVKKVLKLVGNNLSLSFNSEDWVEVNIDGNTHSYREQVSINKGLQNRNLISSNQQGRNLLRNSAYKNGIDDGGHITYVGEITEMVQGEIYIINSEIIKGGVEYHYYLNQRLDWGNGIPQSVKKNEPFVANANHKYLWLWIDIPSNRAEHRKIKLEKGNKPTDWTPAPEETHYITIAGNIDKIKNLQTNAEEIW